MTYSLKDINTRDVEAVEDTVESIFLKYFPDEESVFIHEIMQTVKQMFAGKYKNYGKAKTEYHNREHTLQATLCMARLMEGKILSGDLPRLNARHFRIGITAILLHDVGYLQDASDEEGTGAKYTLEHEQRSCDIAELLLSELNWPKRDIEWVVHLISCTGPRSQINEIRFEDDGERFLGMAVCTADYLGQMADYQYIKKLPILYQEFEESDDYQNIPVEKRMFKSAADLMRKTPGFWQFVLHKILGENCGGVYKYLARPAENEEPVNPYLEKVNRNITKLEALLNKDKEA